MNCPVARPRPFRQAWAMRSARHHPWQVGLALIAASAAHAGPPGDSYSRLRILEARLRESRSATATLEKWCGENALAANPRVHAERIVGVEKPATRMLRARLGIGAHEPVRYRRVRLVCGEHILSEADNWYVPARLTAAMNRSLDETDTPFGRAIQPLRPHRRTLSSRRLWAPAADGALPPMPDALLEQRAIVRDGGGRPLAEVVETYMRPVLGE